MNAPFPIRLRSSRRRSRRCSSSGWVLNAWSSDRQRRRSRTSSGSDARYNSPASILSFSDHPTGRLPLWPDTSSRDDSHERGRHRARGARRRADEFLAIRPSYPCRPREVSADETVDPAGMGVARWLRRGQRWKPGLLPRERDGPVLGHGSARVPGRRGHHPAGAEDLRAVRGLLADRQGRRGDHRRPPERAAQARLLQHAEPGAVGDVAARESFPAAPWPRSDG